MSWYNYPPYVSAAEKAKKLEKKLSKLTKGGYTLSPVKLSSKVIAKTFWGKAWCENLERYSDMDNRLPRGRTYVRNGSVVDLKIGPGSVSAMVNGSELYDVVMKVDELSPMHWKAIRSDCAGGIDSLVELLQGKLSKAVMERICEPDKGLFPKPNEIRMSCNCPDYADVCKHIAAVIYGIGARLDEQPELLFRLRQVDPLELIATAQTLDLPKPKAGSRKVLASDDLSALFGLDLEGSEPATAPAPKKASAKRAPVISKPSIPTKKVTLVKKTATTPSPTKRTTVKTKATVVTKPSSRTVLAAPKKVGVKRVVPKKVAQKKSAPKQVKVTKKPAAVAAKRSTSAHTKKPKAAVAK
jgi:uncharacterized Zn finger protein